jgi:hypothetical protein
MRRKAKSKVRVCGVNATKQTRNNFPEIQTKENSIQKVFEENMSAFDCVTLLQLTSKTTVECEG